MITGWVIFPICPDMKIDLGGVWPYMIATRAMPSDAGSGDAGSGDAGSGDHVQELMLPESPMTVIAEDNTFRCGKGNGDGLWPIASLPNKPTYPFEVPTFAPPGWHGGCRREAISQEDYNRSILAYHPEVVSILPIAGVVIAGGAAAQPFNGTAGDIDFFLVGVEPGAVWKKVSEIEIAIQEKFLGSSASSQISFMKKIAHGVITIFVRTAPSRENGWTARTICKIQIILRLFTSISGLLHGFDIGSCAIAFDGAVAYTTLIGAYSLSHRVNIVCPSRRSTSYESRLKKYFDRGYALVLPYLDTGRLVPGETLSLPFLRARVDSVHGPLAFGDVMTLEDAPCVSDYEEAEDEGLRLSWDRWGTHLANGWRLARGAQSFVIRSVTQRNSRGLETNETAPFAGFDRAEPTFQDVLPRAAFVEIVYRLARSVNHNDRVKLSTLHRFFGLSQEQVIKFVLAVTEASDPPQGPHRDRIVIDMLPALRPFCEAIFDRYDEVAAKNGGRLEWLITEDPSRQYTATLNPRIVDPQVWYGDAYLASAAVSTPAGVIKALRGLLEAQGGAAAGVYAGCALCFDERLVSGAPNSVTFGCGHVFHWSLDSTGCEGVRTWAIGHSTCPTCRRPFTETHVPAARRPTRTIPLTVAW